MKVLERRIVYQEWYETEYSKTGWDSYNWEFDSGACVPNSWEIIEHLRTDKHGNPTIGVAEREIEI